ncbi:MAG: hypothetical protein H0W99_07350 [Acidobacteria bacterium]|nr:hypothetical protein [Acidobacteriota bacterium]
MSDMVIDMPQQEVYSGQIINGLLHAIRAGESGLSRVPMLVKRVLKDGMWREFLVERTGGVVCHARFIDFVTTKPLEGLGADLDLLKRICAEHTDVLDLIDREVQGKHGGDRKSDEIKWVIHPLDTSDQRDRSGKHLRRLRKDFPKLHQQVLENKLTVTQAATKAGFYPKRVSVNLTSAGSAASTIIKASGEDFARELICALKAGLRHD